MQTLAAYDVSQWIMVGNPPNGGIFIPAESLDAAVNMAPHQLVLLEPWYGVELKDFVHPPKASYVFGNASLSLSKYRETALSVRIPTPLPIDMFAAACVGTVLNDRFLKNEC